MRWLKRLLNLLKWWFKGMIIKGQFSGLNNTKSAELLKNDEFQDCQNIRVNTDMSVDKLTGYTNLLASAETNYSHEIEQIKIGDERILFFASNYGIKKITGTSTTELLANLNSINHSDILKFNDKLLHSNGTDNVKKIKLLNDSKIAFIESNNLHIVDYSFGKEIVVSLGYTANNCTSDSDYIYISDETNNAVKKYDYLGGYLSSVTINTVLPSPSPTAPWHLGNNDTAVFVMHTYSPSGNGCISRIAKSTFTVTHTDNSKSDFDSTTIIDAASSYVYAYSLSAKTLYRYNTADLSSESTTDWTAVVLNWFTIKKSTNTLIRMYYSAGLGIVFNGDTTNEIPTSTNYIMFDYINNLTGLYDTVTKKTYFVNTSGEIIKTINSFNPNSIVSFSTKSVSLTNWFDLCSPFKPIQNVLSDAGNVNATVYYKSTWYNSDTFLETSGGLASLSAAPSSKKVEVFFDFTESQIDKTKADEIGVDQHRLYRKDGTADYKLQGTYPIYWEMTSDIATGTLSMTMADAKGMTFSDTFYILQDDEIMAVSAISGTTFTIARAQKGTTAAIHTTESPIYLYSIIDNTLTASLGAVCPTTNDFVEPAKYMTYTKSRFIMANSPSYPSRIWYSGFNSSDVDEDIIKEDQWFDIGKDDGDEITGLKVYQDNVFVFKTNSIWYLAGDLDNATPIKIPNSVGVVSGKTIVEVMNGLVFLSKQGVMFLYGFQLVNLSRQFIQTTIANINWQYAYKAWAEYFPKYNEVWISVPYSTSTTNSKVIILNTAMSDFSNEYSQKCFYLSNMALSAGKLVKDSSDNDVLYTADYSGQLHQQDSGNAFHSSAIDGYVITRKIAEPDFDLHKKYRETRSDYQNKGTSTNLVLGYDTGDGTYTEANLSMSGTANTRTYKDTSLSGESGNYIQLRYRNANASEPFRVYRWQVRAKIHKAR